MNFNKLILLITCCTLLTMGCRSVTDTGTKTSGDLLGSWEGCDGRVVTFTQNEDGEISGRYTALGGLTRYGFQANEIGYKLRKRAAGSYSGTVKWRNTRGEATWRDVVITIQGDRYMDNSSDNCAREMKRL